MEINFKIQRKKNEDETHILARILFLSISSISFSIAKPHKLKQIVSSAIDMGSVGHWTRVHQAMCRWQFVLN